MDFLNGHDRKFGYLEEPDMVDFLDPSDIFHTPLTHGFPSPDEEPSYEHDWLNSFLDDPVLNDRMMTDAMQPCIKSEHSYSINDQHNGTPGSPLGLGSQEDMDSDLFTAGSALDLTMKSVSTSPAKMEPSDIQVETYFATPSSSTATTTTNHHAPAMHTSTFINGSLSGGADSLCGASTLHHGQQPTIIVTTTSSTSTAAAASSAGTSFLTGFPSIHIKQEPMDSLDHSHEQTVNLESIVLPPTPPGSSGSDSDGSQSPQAPSSPSRQSSAYRHSATSPLGLAAAKSLSQPLFVNPISQSGVLILSEEEKRTLISEGYPIPNKLPLTKQEEKNLKKIRRKIKNKISAQESRRKKKEYLEALEKRVEAYNHENSDLKKKVENLENNNRSLLGQLQKLQSLVSKMPKAATATQTSTALMVVVFCFAVFLGSMSPSSLNIGYSSSKPARLAFVPPQDSPLPPKAMGPHLMTADDTSDPYATPNLKSRMLMSLDQEDYCDDTRSMPWHHAMSCPKVDPQLMEDEDMDEEAYDYYSTLDDGTDLYPDLFHQEAPGVELPESGHVSTGTPRGDTTVVMVVPGSGLENSTDGEGKGGLAGGDLGVNPKDMADQAFGRNITSELETVA